MKLEIIKSQINISLPIRESFSKRSSNRFYTDGLISLLQTIEILVLSCFTPLFLSLPMFLSLLVITSLFFLFYNHNLYSYLESVLYLKNSVPFYSSGCLGLHHHFFFHNGSQMPTFLSSFCFKCLFPLNVNGTLAY